MTSEKRNRTCLSCGEEWVYVAGTDGVCPECDSDNVAVTIEQFDQLKSEVANRKLQEKGVRVYARLDQGFKRVMKTIGNGDEDVWSIGNDQYDTHTALLIDLQPIKKEPVVFECFVSASEDMNGRIDQHTMTKFIGKRVKVTVEEVT